MYPYSLLDPDPLPPASVRRSIVLVMLSESSSVFTAAVSVAGRELIVLVMGESKRLWGVEDSSLH